MKRSFPLMLLALAPFSVHAEPAPAQPDSQSMALIAALHLDDAIMHTANAGVADAQERGAAAVKLNKCFAQAMVDDLGTQLALLVPQILNREQISEALKFFQSPTGQKLMAHNVARLRQASDGRVRPDPPPTAEDTRLAKAFLDTSTGRKINETRYLLDAPETQRFIKQKADAVTARCKSLAQASAP